MTTIVFDTHAFVKELAEAGMPEKQAEVLARSQATLINETLATKQDLKELEARLRRDMKELELRLKHDLTIRLGSMMVVAIGVVAALVKLL
jgi:predicted phage-related endonuclease